MVLGYCFIWGQFPLFLEDSEQRQGLCIVQHLPLEMGLNWFKFKVFCCSCFNVLCNAGNIFYCCCLQHITGAPTEWDPAPEKDSINFDKKKKRFKNINVSISSVGKVAVGDRRVFQDGAPKQNSRCLLYIPRQYKQRPGLIYSAKLFCYLKTFFKARWWWVRPGRPMSVYAAFESGGPGPAASVP